VGPTWQQARASALGARALALVGPPISLFFDVGAEQPLRTNLLCSFNSDYSKGHGSSHGAI